MEDPTPLEGRKEGRKEGSREEGAFVIVKLFDNTFQSLLSRQVESAGPGKSLLKEGTSHCTTSFIN